MLRVAASVRLSLSTATGALRAVQHGIADAMVDEGGLLDCVVLARSAR